MTASEVSSNRPLVLSLKSMNLEQIIEYTWNNLKYRDVIASKIMTLQFEIDESRFTIDKYHMPFRNKGITSMELAMKFVKLFGQRLKRIELICDGFSDAECQQLLILISQYCPNLFEAGLPMKWNNLITRPFDSVRRVLLGKNCKKIDNELEFNRFYPNMEEISVDSIEVTDVTFFAQYYPNLRNFTYSIYKKGIDPALIDHLFKLNPQIETVNADGKHSYELFQKISTQLINLKTFNFDAYPELFAPPNRPLHFSNVRTLVVRNWDGNILPNLAFVFEQLERLTYFQSVYIDEFSSLSFSWLTSLNNRNLKEISMPSTLVGFNGLNEIAAKCPNLESITFRMPMGSLTNEKFLKFLGNPIIKSIKIRDVQDLQRRDLAERLPEDWSIKFDIEREAFMMGDLFLKRY